ncbi:MAG: 16S rRNA (guanine(966)-N(2))-methyltransferase RsmD [Bacilli bacterium]
MIRIVAGKYRSRMIQTPSSPLTMPTKEMVREGVFSALGEKVINAVVLDLFAGSGALGIEALSRGAKKAIFVDSSKEAAHIISENIHALGDDNAEVLNLSYEMALDKFQRDDIKFDIVFLDPPYKSETYISIIKTLIKNELLSSFAIIIVESDKELVFDATLFSKIKTYRYGYSKIYIMRRGI